MTLTQTEFQARRIQVRLQDVSDCQELVKVLADMGLIFQGIDRPKTAHQETTQVGPSCPPSALDSLRTRPSTSAQSFSSSASNYGGSQAMATFPPPSESARTLMSLWPHLAPGSSAPVPHYNDPNRATASSSHPQSRPGSSQLHRSQTAPYASFEGGDEGEPLQHVQYVRPGTAMPNPAQSDSQRADLNGN